MTHQVFLHIDEIVLDGVDGTGDFQAELERALLAQLAAPDLAALMVGGGDFRELSLGQLQLGELRIGMSTLGSALGSTLGSALVSRLPASPPQVGAMGVALPGLTAGPNRGVAGKE